MLISWLHLINWIILLIVVLVALFSKRPTTSKVSMIIARICYLIALGTGLLLLGGAYAAAPVLTIIKVVAALLLIVVIELAFAWRLHHRLNKMWIYLTLFLLLLVGFMGIYLAGGYPF